MAKNETYEFIYLFAFGERFYLKLNFPSRYSKSHDKKQ